MGRPTVPATVLRTAPVRIAGEMAELLMNSAIGERPSAVNGAAQQNSRGIAANREACGGPIG